MPLGVLIAFAGIAYASRSLSSRGIVAEEDGVVPADGSDRLGPQRGDDQVAGLRVVRVVRSSSLRRAFSAACSSSSGRRKDLPCSAWAQCRGASSPRGAASRPTSRARRSPVAPDRADLLPAHRLPDVLAVLDSSAGEEHPAVGRDDPLRDRRGLAIDFPPEVAEHGERSDDHRTGRSRASCTGSAREPRPEGTSSAGRSQSDVHRRPSLIDFLPDDACTGTGPAGVPTECSVSSHATQVTTPRTLVIPSRIRRARTRKASASRACKGRGPWPRTMRASGRNVRH